MDLGVTLGESEKELAKARRRRNVFDPRAVLTGRGHGQVRNRFQAGQVIYSQGDPPEAAFFVESGSIKVSTVVRNGREAVLALHGAGDFFGVRCLLGTPHTATATALIDSSLIRVTTAALCRMVREVPDFAETFAMFLVQRCADDQERLISHLTHSAEQRLAYTLLRLVSSSREDRALPIPISQTLFCQNDRHHRVACQLLHEALQAERLHRVRTRRPNQSSSQPAQCGSGGLALSGHYRARTIQDCAPGESRRVSSDLPTAVASL
jgi:CRP/FNR family transcriptional regulator, cyclic AMP receptor protein